MAFALFVVRVLTELGFEVKHTGRTNDGGVDAEAVLSLEGPTDCVLGARTGTERGSGMGCAGDGTCVSRGICGCRDLRTVRWPAVGAVAPGWDAGIG